MSYSQNMNGEKSPSRKQLLPEGSRAMEVVGVEYGTSKSNNPQFIFSVKDNLTGYVDKFYCVDVQGKRGNLKMMLDACNVQPDETGNYNWDNPDVIGKKIVCDIVHEPNDYINKKGDTVHGKQHKIVEISAFEVSHSNGDIAWEE